MALLFNANMIEVHVLLVGNDVVSLLETSRLLEFNSYRVTAVGAAAIASSLLAKEKVRYDVVMVEVSSSDVRGFQLAHDAINMGYTVILMSDNTNVTLAKCAIEDGAFMFIQKPATTEVLKYLWQHVLRENARKSKENARLREIISTTERSSFILNSGWDMIHASNIEADANVHEHGSRDIMYRDGFEGFKHGSEDDIFAYRGKKPKIFTEWTPELHEKFVEAVRELGEGRCFPSDILELMNVPGLKRMQVASHLQKCRQGWKASASSMPKRRGPYPRISKGGPKFLVGDEERDEQAPPAKPVENLIGSVEPENMKQSVEISGNASNNIVHVNDISGGHMIREMVSESNHEAWTIPFDFAVDDSDGINQMDYSFEGSGLDQTFSQFSAAADEEPDGSFWRSFFSNFSSD